MDELIALCNSGADKQKRRSLILANRKEDAERLVLKKVLEERNGVVGHPKADYLFLLTWSRGYAKGVNEVIMLYEEMVYLIK